MAKSQRHSRQATRPGAELELTVDSLAQGGRGVARSDGLVVFVRGAVPGDRVRAVVDRVKRAYAEATAREIVEPSPERVDPTAPHPGAPWQVLSYERQLAEKQSQVTEAFIRLGGFDRPPISTIVPAPEVWRYRNKVEYSFGTAGGELVLGFHAPGRFDRILDCESDILASKRVDQARAAVKQWCRSQGLSAYDREQHTGFLRNLAVREGRRTGDLQLRLVTSSSDFCHEAFAEAIGASSLLWTQTSQVAETTGGGNTRVLRGDRYYTEHVSGLSLRISAESFFQTNTEMAERLYGVVLELARPQPSIRVLDLFCGIGTIGLILARSVAEVVGVEEVEAAVADAYENARRNEIANARFVTGDVRTALRPLVAETGRPDLVIVDPPRAGLSKKVIRRVAETGASRVVYVSCNPTTLASNARQLADSGYELSSVRPVDMFAQTPHIECVALFER